ncbi:MAG: ArsR family transcriptional regulator [Acidobacteria bacterium]|nr:ArsR family transcriptional regulator [Acidobacteriota bacterium]
MAQTKFDERFFDSTRGRIVLALRGSDRTVNDLAAELGITDNAVRAHLLALERDAIVLQRGTVKGFRKPHFVYGLAEDARHLFPTAYDSLLNRLLAGFKKNLAPRAFIQTLREVGRTIAADRGTPPAKSRTEKLNAALSTLEELGGAANIVRDPSGTRIESECCPFADVVAEHPEVCKVAESLVAEITGEKVVEKCDRTGLPKCRFEIGDK